MLKEEEELKKTLIVKKQEKNKSKNGEIVKTQRDDQIINL